MSEGSGRSRVTITLGRTGQVVSRDVSDLECGFELPRAGKKRSVKERLGNQFDGQVLTKRQRGEASFSGNDLQITQNHLRFKLLQKNAQKRAQSEECSTMDLRTKLSRTDHAPRSLDSRPRMPPSRTARASSPISHPAWALDDIRRRTPERYVTTSRGHSPPRNAASSIGNPRGLSPPARMIGNPRASSPPTSAARMMANPREISPPRSAGRIIVNPRDLSPSRNAGRMISNPRGLSAPRNDGRMISNPRGPSPPRNTRSFSGGSRPWSPSRNVGSYMGSSRGFSPPRNPGSYIGSSMGSPPSRNMDEFHGRSRMLDDVRASPYAVRGVINSHAPTSGATFPRPMLPPPPVPNPHPLPPLSQLPPLGSMMQNSPFPMEEPLTVENFLNSIGLGKYSLAFKREEVDMTTIKQMKESDLKDLIIPMGPRKKILQAIACLPNR